MKYIFYFLKQIHSFGGKVLYINLLAMAFIGLLDGAAILMLMPLLSVTGVVDLDTSGIPFGNVFDFLREYPSYLVLMFILVGFVLLVVGQTLIQQYITVKNSQIQLGFLRNLKLKTYASILYANWGFFIKNRKSDLVNLLTTELSRAGGGTYFVLQFLSSLVFTFIQIGVAFWLSPVITSFVLGCGVVLLLFNRNFLKKSSDLGSKNYTLGKDHLAGITEQINGIKDIKCNTLEESRYTWYQTITKGIETEHLQFVKLKTTSQSYYKMMLALFLAIFIFGAVTLFNAQSVQLVLVVLIFSRLWPRVSSIQASLEQISATIPALKAIITIQEECKSAREFTLDDVRVDRGIQLEEAIECRNVHFRYSGNEEKYALKNINLVIPANKMTAIVGPSGAGKSTLIDMLMGLNQPEQGEIIIDGVPLTKSNVTSLRQKVSYVAQDPFLFHDSIRENLQLVAPNATEEDMWEALDFASAAEFVRGLPQQLDTVIGDRGIRLSGGERQRLVLARAILRKPSILVLDEATSALDTENEAKIQEAIERIKGKMTIIVIAHRLSTISNADQVVVLDQGEIIQQGGFQQLSREKRSMFYKLLQKQMDVFYTRTMM